MSIADADIPAELRAAMRARDEAGVCLAMPPCEDAPPGWPHDEWIQRFAARFGELQPMVSAEQACEVGEAAFAGAHDLEPEEAALVFSEILDASVPLNALTRAYVSKEKPA